MLEICDIMSGMQKVNNDYLFVHPNIALLGCSVQYEVQEGKHCFMSTC